MKMDRGKDPDDARHRQIAAGVSLWAVNATLRPMCYIRRMLEGYYDEQERSFVCRLLEENNWRTLRTAPTLSTPPDATIVITDGSAQGAGVVTGGVAYALPWRQRRPMEQQQKAEWDAATLGIEKGVQRGTSWWIYPFGCGQHRDPLDISHGKPGIRAWRRSRPPHPPPPTWTLMVRIRTFRTEPRR